MKVRVDVAIIGSGFSGSILAWILATLNVRVAVIDSAVHPRFSIGESSTPIADTILRRLGATYQLPELASLSSWGSWRRDYPDVACGRKRGFSYYVHDHGEPFNEVSMGARSLLVAASASDAVADTHWYRAEVDRFFFERAVTAGAIDLTGHHVVAHEESVDSSRYETHCMGQRKIVVDSEWVIDASGHGGVLAKLTGAKSRIDELKTRTHATYGHYTDVGSWTELLKGRGISSGADPFNGDDAAQHHLLGQGWLWMLRFNNGVTSVGYTAPMSESLDWSGYPSIERLMRDAKLIGPSHRPCTTGRLQRFFDPVVDTRRIMLPSSAVTIDPLHSTGIALALAGVERIVGILSCADMVARRDKIDLYRTCLFGEVRLIDRLVSTAYATIGDFQRFTVACMLYFAGAIRCEERIQRDDTWMQLWSADDPEFVEFVDWACDLVGDCRQLDFEDCIRQRLRQWNTAGLMDPDVANRYAYTVTKKEIATK